METVCSELKIWKPPIIAQYDTQRWRTYQNINSSIVSKGAMNSFKEIFPLALMHTLPPFLLKQPDLFYQPLHFYGKNLKFSFSDNLENSKWVRG